MQTVTLEHAREHLAELVAEAGRGVEVLITKDNEPVAKLAAPGGATPSTAAPGRWAAMGMFKGQIEIAPDFDQPLEEMRPYME